MSFLPSANVFPEITLTPCHSYLIHGVRLLIYSNDPALVEELPVTLYHFLEDIPPGNEEKAASSPTIILSFQVVEDLSRFIPAFIEKADPVSYYQELSFFRRENLLYITVPDKFILTCDLKSATATGYIHPSVTNDYSFVFHQIFYPALVELLKTFQMFTIHTAGVVWQGEGILFPARAGSGKSTLTINLLRHGFQLLSDDICFLTKSGSQLCVLGFPEPIQVWEESITHFPELAFLKNDTCLRYKRSFQAEQVFPGTITPMAEPKFLILPQIAHAPQSRLLPIPKTEALTEIIPQSLMVANRDIARHHLDTLIELVESCRCFKLLAGQDIDQIPELILSIL